MCRLALIHGAATTSRVWRHVVPLLADGSPLAVAVPDGRIRCPWVAGAVVKDPLKTGSSSRQRGVVASGGEKRDAVRPPRPGETRRDGNRAQVKQVGERRLVPEHRIAPDRVGQHLLDRERRRHRRHQEHVRDIQNERVVPVTPVSVLRSVVGGGTGTAAPADQPDDPGPAARRKRWTAGESAEFVLNDRLLALPSRVLL